MSEPSSGDAVLSVYTFQARSASLPYLRRNLRKAIHNLTMGSAFSSPKTSLGGKLQEEIMASEDEDNRDSRPFKRRRINYVGESETSSQNSIASGFRQPYGQVTNGSTRVPVLTRKVEALQPSDFYRKPKASTYSDAVSASLRKYVKQSRGSITSILPKEPYNFTESLRVDFIEVISIPSHNDVSMEFTRGRKVPFEIKCRCSLAIFYGKNDANPGEVQYKDYVEISRANKACTLQVDHGPAGEVSRKIILHEPFVFTPENFYVNRKMRKANGQFLPGKEFQNTFGFADDYTLQIFIEPIGFDKDWPPIVIPPFVENGPGDSSRRQNLPISQALLEDCLEKDELYLFCKTNAFVDCSKSSRAAPIHVCHKNTKQRVQYALKFQMEWALPTPFTTAGVILPSRFEHSIVSTPAALIPPGSPISRRQHLLSVPVSPADERAHRRRSNVTTYNLKALSAQAQGKSPRKTKGPRSKSEQRAWDDGEISVKYCFHRAHASDMGIKRETIVSGMKCPFCNRDSISLEELRMHLQTDHSTFKFSLRKREPRVEIFVELSKLRLEPDSNADSAHLRTYQIGKPMTLFDLGVFLRGDDSWTRIRYGPQNNCWPEHLVDQMNDSSMSSSPHDSRHSSPNTSTDLMDFEYHDPKPSHKPKVFVIPKTTKPLYDTTTKQVLEPGDQLSDGDSDVDESWLNHRKQDLLNEFVDVAEEEKEYLHQWNIFMVGEHLTSDKFIPQATLKFAEANKAWIMEDNNRRREFMKHLESFRLRGVLDTNCIQKCILILKSVEHTPSLGNGNERQGDVEMGGVEALQPTKPRGPNACICGETPRGPHQILCRGYVSSKRFDFETNANAFAEVQSSTLSPRLCRGPWKTFIRTVEMR
jgi:hypothetical protein